jgi:hypothetical protein
MTDTELECRWQWWRAAFDFFQWSNAEASAAVSGFMWGEVFSPIRGW